MKKSVKEANIHQLNECFLILKSVHRNFCSTDDSEEDAICINESLTIVLLRSLKTLDIIKSIQKTYWLKFTQSAKTISALLPIFEKITEVVQNVSELNEEVVKGCRSFSELLGSVADLRASLVNIKCTLVHTINNFGLSTTLIFAIAGVTCLLVGGILIVTPAGIPLLVIGGVTLVASHALSYGTKTCCYITVKQLCNSEKEGYTMSKKFVEGQPSKLSEFLESQKWPV